MSSRCEPGFFGQEPANAAAAAIGTGVAGLKAGSSLFGPSYPALQGIEFPWQAGVAGVVAGVLGGLIPAIRAAAFPSPRSCEPERQVIRQLALMVE